MTGPAFCILCEQALLEPLDLEPWVAPSLDQAEHQAICAECRKDLARGSRKRRLYHRHWRQELKGYVRKPPRT